VFADLKATRFLLTKMYYRIVLKEGASLINMRQVREVSLRGANLTIYYPTTFDGGFFGRGFVKSNEFYVFANENDSKAEFEKIQKFLETESSKSAPLG
jgi:hypothetical protein